MAIRTQIFPVWDDAKHTCNGQRESFDDIDFGLTECYRCKQDAVAVEVNGKRYANYPGGRIETARGLYVGEEDGVVFSVHHEGLVIATRERNYYDDSDFYALVWDPTTKSIGIVDYATTRMGGTDRNSASADLAEEHKADYREYLIQQQVKALAADERRRWQEAAYAAVTPTTRGQRVRVVKGRKVPVGFEGVIVWTGDGFRAGQTRIGIRSDDGETQFTDSDNAVVLIDPDDLPYLADFQRTDEERLQVATGIVDFEGNRGYIRRTQAAPGMIVVA